MDNDTIFVGGDFDSIMGYNISNLAKLTPNGTLDTSFNSSTSFGEVNCIEVQNNSKLVVGFGDDYLTVQRYNFARERDETYKIKGNVETLIPLDNGDVIAAGDDWGSVNYGTGEEEEEWHNILKILGDAPPTSTSKITNKDDLIIYPNPTDGRVNLSHKCESVNVYGSNGNLILSKQNTSFIDMSSFSVGVYFIKTEL